MADTGAGDRNRLLGSAIVEAPARRWRKLGPWPTRRVSRCRCCCAGLDHFKLVTDRFGHDAGDRVLTSFASLLRNSVRAHDTVIRWGGEEFLVIVPGCDHLGAAGLAERLLSACQGEPPVDVSQTTSIGIAVYPAAARTPEALIGAADDALYRAKREGRNRH